MQPALNPVVAEKLAVFGRRWRRLVLLRGLCGGIISFLGALTVAAFADWLFILPDPARFAVSASVYLITVLVVWLFCVRPLLRAPDARQLARLVEKAAPQLREDLLSAVELSQSRAQHDSPAFRELLQTNVASRLRDLRMESLLPPKLIAFWLRGAALAAAIVVTLCFVPELRYGRLVARTLAPMADLERVSRTHIRLVEPADIASFQPHGDNLPVVVEVTGPQPDRVVLETLTKDAPAERIAMPPVSGRQFGTQLALGAGEVEFRVKAGDAITQKFTVRTRPRPHVARFEKIFNFPAYTKFPPRNVTEENGDLSALEGTMVELKLHLNQPVRDASIAIEAKGLTNIVKLPASAAPLLTVQVPVTVAATYRVQLVAAETGFENKFSPIYEIRPVPDLVPRAAIDSPQSDFIARPEEIVPLQGSAFDDIGLAKVAQLVQINDGAWSETVLAENAGTNANIARRWDFLQLGVAPGDRVNTKLLAVDLKGSRAESATLHIVVGSAGFDASRLAALEAKRQLHESLVGVRDASAELRKAVSFENAQKIRSGGALERQQLLAGASKSAEEADRQLDRAQSLSREALKDAAPGREASDLTALSRALSQLRNESLGAARGDLERLSQNQNRASAAADNVNVNDAARSTGQLAESAALVEAADRDLLASAEADALLANLAYLSREQEKINSQAAADSQNDPQSFVRLARREAGAAKETAATEEQFNSLRKHTPRGTADRAQKAQDTLKSARAQMEKALAPNQPAVELLPAARNLQKGVENTASELRPLGKELAMRADKSREDLLRVAGTAGAKLEQLRKEVEAQAEADRKADYARNRQQASPFLDAQAARQRERANEQFKSALEQLKDRATAEELRRDSDAQFTADTTKAAQALAAMRAASGADAAKQAESLKDFEKAMRALEAGRQLSELDNALGQLARAERWEKDSPDAAQGRARDWDWAAKRLQAAPKDIRASGLPDKAVKSTVEASRNPAAGELDREMAERQSGAKRPADASAKLDRLAEAVQRARSEAEPALADARAKIEAAAPKLSEMMAGLAKSAVDLEQSARAAQQQADADAARDESRRLAAKQEDFSKQVEELKQAVRRDANVQDTASPAGRERARDADDAVAMLREPPPKAQEAFNAAAAVRDNATQKNSLNEAATQEKKLGDTLQQLSQHYAAMESGRDASASRQALRKAEDDLGVKAALDRNYDTLQKLNDLLKKSDQERLTELENQLKKDNVMRKELGQVGRETLDDAHAALREAQEKQAEIAKRLADAQRAQADRGAVPAQVADLAARARRLATNDIPPLNREVADAKILVTGELNRGQGALNTAASRAPADMTRPPEQFVRNVAEMLPHLQNAARELQAGADRAAATARQAKNLTEAQAMQAARTKVARVAEEAAQLAALAQQVSSTLTNSVTPEQAMARAAAEQVELANRVSQAGADLARSGRHDARLGTPQGDALQQIGRDTTQIAQQPMRQALDSLATQRNPAAAQQAMDQSQRELARQSEALARALNESVTRPQTAANPTSPQNPSSAQSSGSPEPRGTSTPQGQPVAQASGNAPSANASGADPAEHSPASLSPEESRWMARSLDRLDAQMNPASLLAQMSSPSAQQQGKPNAGQQSSSQKGDAKGDGKGEGKGGEGKGSSAAEEALSEAVKSQSSSMMSARANGNVPGESGAPGDDEAGQPGEGRGNFSLSRVARGRGLLPGEVPRTGGEWGRLPPKVAQGLAEGQREGVAGEFRRQVELYFKVVADKAKERK